MNRVGDIAFDALGDARPTVKLAHNDFAGADCAVNAGTGGSQQLRGRRGR